MIITNLELYNFRSYERATFSFEKGLNVFVGPNGSGKTNLVEAVHYLSLARSFRTSEDVYLIKTGAKSSVIRATIKEGEIEKKIAISIQNNGKKILIDEQPVNKVSELSKIVNVSVFEPKDVLLFDGLPKERRKFLDTTICKQNRKYLQELMRYENLLKERNELIKQEEINKDYLGVVTDLMIKSAEVIVRERSDYLKKTNQVLSQIVKTIKGENSEVSLIYEPYVELNEQFVKKSKELFEKTLESDIKRKTTSVGPHREDFKIEYGKEHIANYGSQGENRVVAIALKMSPYFLIKEEEKKPIVVLDDVLSELDIKTQERLIPFLEKLKQVFITTTKYEKSNGKTYQFKERTE